MNCAKLPSDQSARGELSIGEQGFGDLYPARTDPAKPDRWDAFLVGEVLGGRATVQRLLHEPSGPAAIARHERPVEALLESFNVHVGSTPSLSISTGAPPGPAIDPYDGPILRAARGTHAATLPSNNPAT